MSIQIAPSFLSYLQATSPDLYETLVNAEKDFCDQHKPTFEVLINSCYGGYGFSEEFAQEFNNEHQTSYLLHDFDNMDRHDARLIKTYKRLFKPRDSCDKNYNEQWNGSCANVSIVTIEYDMYLIDEYDGNEWVVTPNSSLNQRWIKI